MAAARQFSSVNCPKAHEWAGGGARPNGTDELDRLLGAGGPGRNTVLHMRPLAALLSPVVRRLMYPSAGTKVEAEETDFELLVDGVALRGWEVNPGQKRALVYYGGNGEAVDGLVEELSAWFPDHTSYLVAYRDYGASEGTPSESVLTTDALAVFKHAKARHPGSVDVIGRSLGSAVAIQVAVRRPRSVRRLVLVTPFDSLVATVADHYPWLPVRHLLQDALRRDIRDRSAALLCARTWSRTGTAKP